MNFPDTLLSSGWYIAGHLLFALVLAQAVRYAPWRRLNRPDQLHIWLGTIVFLMVLWTIKTGIKPGLSLHLLGATAFTLMFGPTLAVVGLTLVLAAATLSGAAGWWSFSLNALVMVVLPVYLSYGVFRLVERRLPNHFFVYVFLNAFLGAAAAMLVTGLVATLLLAAAGAYALDYLAGEYLPFFILLASGEALTTGMTVTIMVVYRPGWVATFDDARYLQNK
ncbi:MAG: energy-coupling factor ABC transporter permease [Betaproteobacteria bacterium]|nr:energy-coupling factor ABC transporter permease [Betaproteobacteria bacterium]